jgi:hypothetical protein
MNRPSALEGTRFIDAVGDKPVRLAGKWLSDIGFGLDAVAMVRAEPGLVTLRLQEDAVENYQVLVKFARTHGMNLLQVRHAGRSQYMEITGHSARKAGFTVGDVYTAEYEYGLIQIRKAVV